MIRMIYLCRMRFILSFLTILLAGSAIAQTPQWRENAWKGDSISMMELASRFSLGEGVEKNEDSARKYIRLSAKKGHTDAQFLLGTQLTSNLYDPKKFSEGMEWLKKAAAQNQVDALSKLSVIYRTRDDGDSETSKFYDLKLAYSFAEKAAKQGDINALKYCAECRLKGTGTTRNDSIAIAFLKEAGEKHNDAMALCKLGDLSLEGKMGGSVNLFLAKAYYDEALGLPYLNMDQINAAELGLFKVDRVLKSIQNASLQGSGISAPGSFEYPIRKE